MEKFNMKTTWWQKYRHAKNHPSRLSVEMVLRRSFAQVLRDYVQHCSLAGIKKVCERDIPVRHRIFWTILTGFTYGAVIYMLMNIWKATLSKPLLVTMDSSTYPIAEIDFPAVAVCNINRISMKSVKKLAAEIYQNRKGTHPNTTLNDIEWYLLQGGRLVDYSYNETLRLRLLKFATHAQDTRKIVYGMERLAPSCNEMLLRCSWSGQEVNCSEIFTMRRTVLGHCCAFNYVLKYNSMGRPDKTKNLIASVMRQKQAGMYHGLIVVLDPLLEDYGYPLRSVDGFDIFLFDPTHFADPSGGRVLQRLSQPNEAMVLELRSVRQIATTEVRKYPLSTRKCLFHDEVPEHFGNMYSYSACIARCRIKTIRSLCKCTPYFLPAGNNSVCSLVDLWCLNKYKEKLLYFYPFNSNAKIGLEMERLDSLYCPECLPDCELTKHSTKSSVIPFRDRGLGDQPVLPDIAKGLNVTESSNLAMVYIYQPTNDGVLDRLDVVSYWYEILSNIGGFAGILVGFSIISVVEIIYYFVVRFIQVLCSNWKLYY
ncbi:sodium channel protein Nach-like [Cydia pomonella]|uniref:sodium channel protein Nach-like n=1 Tax=Cydia pomonella TaxID=82600 RepID=UPI002ADE30E8|nr:sodium channel protein Nach-like [Cydia pomonella]